MVTHARYAHIPLPQIYQTAEFNINRLGLIFTGSECPCKSYYSLRWDVFLGLLFTMLKGSFLHFGLALLSRVSLKWKVTVRKPARKQSKDVHMGMEVSNPKKVQTTSREQSGVGQRHDLAVAATMWCPVLWVTQRDLKFLRILSLPENQTG